MEEKLYIIKSIMSDKVEIRDNGLNGKGVFAKEKIEKGEIVFIKGGYNYNENMNFIKTR